MNQAEEKKKGMVEYTAADGNPIELTSQMVRDYLVSGQGDKITKQEMGMFLALCKMQKLNPFLREVYLIKYGEQPAQMVVGIETFRKRAFDNPKYKGHNPLIVKWTDTEKVAGCKVFVEGYTEPIYVEVDFDEYVGKKKDGSINRMWHEKPRTMLKKVAESQALRMAFPKEYGGMYTTEEINTVNGKDLPKEPVNIEDAIFTESDMGDSHSTPPSAGPEDMTATTSGPVPLSDEGQESMFQTDTPGITKDQLTVILAELKGMKDSDRKKWLDKYQTDDPATLTYDQARKLIGDIKAAKRGK